MCNLHLRRLCAVVINKKSYYSEIIVYCIMSLKLVGCNQLCSFAPRVFHGATSSRTPVLLDSKFPILFDCRVLAIFHPLENEQPARTLSTLGHFK